MEASTINPSDNIFIRGHYFKRPLPTTPGFEGCGKVEKAVGADLQHLVGKRVSFRSTTGSWAEYSTASDYFVIDDDVPVASAASGIVNPLTVLGFLHTFRKNKHHAIIHTAAASSLGRQLARICRTENIPLINVVRRQEQADLLKSEGAEHVVVTEGDWQAGYSELVKKVNADALFDALGGGQVTQKLIEGLHQPATVYVYGMLAREPLVVSNAGLFLSGLKIEGFLLFSWWAPLPKEEKQPIIDNYSKYLKGDLSTKTVKEYHLKDIKEAIETSNTKATEGKVLLRP